MNKGYEYKNDDQQVEITDDNGNKKTIEYTKNLDEILVKENVIEQIENDINSSAYALGYQERKLETQKTRIKNILKILIPVITSTIIISIFVKEFLILYVLGMICGVISTITEIQEKRKIKNTINAITVKLHILEEKLRNEKMTLDNLKKSKKERTPKQKDDKHFKSLSESELLKLQSEELLVYQTGYCIDIYYQAYEEGFLRDILSGEYNQNEIETIEYIAKTQGPVLSRRKKRR